MYPVLFSIDKLSVSSFGVFLALGFVFGLFLVWRLSRAWDLDEEKILDLTLLTFLWGLIGSRLYFVLQNLHYFSQNILMVILFTKYPGFSFWGSLLGGWLALKFFSKQKKIDFWQVADIASVGFLGGLIFTSLGCFLGGCNIGIPANFFSVTIVGTAGKRFAVQILEAILYSLALMNLWSKSIRFHRRGTVLGLTLIYIGLIQILTQPLKPFRDEGLFLSFILIILGVYIYYKVTNRNIRKDISDFINYVQKLLTDSLTRKAALARLKTFWYNRKTAWSWNLRNLKKNLKKINVKVSYKNHKLN